MHGSHHGQYGGVGILRVACIAGTVWSAGYCELDRHGCRGCLPGVGVRTARALLSCDGRPIRIHPRCLWRLRGVSGCVGLLDLNLGLTPGDCGRLYWLPRTTCAGAEGESSCNRDGDDRRDLVGCAD